MPKHLSPNDAPSADPKAFTVRLDPATYDKLAAAIKADGRKAKTVWDEAISNWLAGRVGTVDRATAVKQLQVSIASAVHQRLMEDEGWLSDLVVARERRSFEQGIIGDRSTHYAEEKNILAKCLVEPQLMGQIAKTLQSDNSSVACLVIDSGSGPVPFFERLISALAAEARRNLAGRVVVLTNNIAGAGTYMNLARGDSGKGTLQHGAAGPFTCSLLPGEVNSDYAAVLGDEAVKALLNQTREDNRGRPIHFIGLLAANWVQVRPAQVGNPYSIPLVADKDQIDIKRALCSLCDYVYLPVPTPKLFVDCTIDEINEGLRPVGRTYQPIFDMAVKEDLDLARKVRLVTTLRPETSDILYTHSRVLRAMYSSSKIGDAQKRESNEFAEAGAYFFEDRTQSGKPPAEQQAIAFPHGEHTRKREFMKRFFMIS